MMRRGQDAVLDLRQLASDGFRPGAGGVAARARAVATPGRGSQLQGLSLKSHSGMLHLGVQNSSPVSPPAAPELISMRPSHAYQAGGGLLRLGDPSDCLVSFQCNANLNGHSRNLPLVTITKHRPRQRRQPEAGHDNLRKRLLVRRGRIVAADRDRLKASWAVPVAAYITNSGSAARMTNIENVEAVPPKPWGIFATVLWVLLALVFSGVASGLALVLRFGGGELGRHDLVNDGSVVSLMVLILAAAQIPVL